MVTSYIYKATLFASQIIRQTRGYQVKSAYSFSGCFTCDRRYPDLAGRHCYSTSRATMSDKVVFERLPKSLKPSVYHVELKPDLKTLKFSGKIEIEIDVLEKTDSAILNALDLEIFNASFKSHDGAEFKAKNVELSVKEEKATITFDSHLPLGKGALSMNFNGELNDQMKGFYRSKYTSSTGEEKYAAVTQFEATDARRAFPCWDEPAVKAIFNITLVAPKDQVALSNMNVISDEPDTSDSNLHVVKYAPSPIMSSYLVAVVVGEFEYIEDISEDGVKVRVYTAIGKKEQGRFALEIATKVLPFYKNYFNIAYPLPKLDLIAIADFSAGAMENWGLVTYREICLLVDPENTSAIRKQYVAIVVGHEIAHQWFGNLVTMEWWTHLWLNEGFATFMEFLCVDHVRPEFEVWTQFSTDTFTDALELDALKSSHPIEIPVNHPSEIDEIFDSISYKKGASIIRMLHNFIGDKSFSEGLHNYLTKFSYSNTITEDLWAALDASSGKPVGKIMNTWTKQIGFPIISVSSRMEGNKRILTLSQEKFCSKAEDKDDSKWMVPITFVTQKDPKTVCKQVLLEDTTMEVEFDDIPAEHWIKLNPGTVGFYRVQYSLEMLEQFLPSIRDQSLPPLDRLGLQNDLFSMVLNGRVSTVEALKLIEAYVNETNYTVWASISQCLSQLKILLTNTDSVPQFNKFGRMLFSKIFSQTGWDAKPNESHLDALLRSLVIARLVSFEDEAVLAEAIKRFNAQVNGSKIIPADLRGAIYHAVVKQGGEEIFNKMLQLYRESDQQEEKNRIGSSLGATKDGKLISEVLKFSLSDDVRSQDTVFVISSAAMSKEGRVLAWDFFKENKEIFMHRYQGGFLVARLVKNVTENFCTDEMKKAVTDFFKDNNFPGTERTVEQSLESIDVNKRWLERDAEPTIKWLASK